MILKVFQCHWWTLPSNWDTRVWWVTDSCMSTSSQVSLHLDTTYQFERNILTHQSIIIWKLKFTIKGNTSNLENGLRLTDEESNPRHCWDASTFHFRDTLLGWWIIIRKLQLMEGWTDGWQDGDNILAPLWLSGKKHEYYRIIIMLIW